jgi:hypothetical protein
METATDRVRSLELTRSLTVAAYAGLGLLLAWSRLVGLDRSYSSDELATVRHFVGEGPREILAGHYIPNNHQLFSLVGWATTSVWDSAVALRLWSAIPFIAGAVLVTAWLHRRVGALSGVLFLFLATVSPLLLDITRQARGYGLAFLAMAVLVLSALEAVRTGRTQAVVAFCVAGVVGTWTLPNFGVAFVATGAVLLARRELRRTAAIGLAVAAGASLLWYLPHLDDIVEGSRQDYARPIETAWLVTAPLDQILLPALAGIDELEVHPDLATLAFVVLLALVAGSSPLLRSRDSALVLCTAPIVSVAVFWITQTNVAPRFFSFLLVPLLMLLASGAAAILSRFAATGRPIVRTVAAMLALAFVTLQFGQHIGGIARLPREAVRETADAIDALAPESTPVIAYIPYPKDLEHYLGRPVENPQAPAAARRVCERPREVIFVYQPWAFEPAAVPCTQRAGVRHLRFEQYARGGYIDVWLLPPPLQGQP